MTKALRKHPIASVTVVIAAFAIAAFVWDLSAQLRGQLVARCDLMRGHYELLTYGLPPRGLPECGRLLRQRYDIKLRAIAGCVVSRALTDYADAHNRVVLSEIKRRFGRDVLQACMGAEQQHRAISGESLNTCRNL
jgi:hypothetical protein